MIKNKVILLVSTVMFVAVEILLGVLLQISEGDLCILYSYLSVVFACLFFVLFAERSKAYFFTQFALICTVCADYFLVWLNPQIRVPAMIFFLAAQLAYAVRLYYADESNCRRRCSIWLRGGLSAIIITVTAIVLGKSTDALALISMVYYVNLAVNILFAFAQFSKHRVMAIGLLLFICCDTLIGMSMLDGYFVIESDSAMCRLIHPGFDLAWAFYVPSQTLLALSLLPERLKKGYLQKDKDSQ